MPILQKFYGGQSINKGLLISKQIDMQKVPYMYGKTSYTKEMRAVVHDKFKAVTKIFLSIISVNSKISQNLKTKRLVLRSHIFT